MLGDEITYADVLFVATIFSWLCIWAIAYRAGVREGISRERRRITQLRRDRIGYIRSSETLDRRGPCTKRTATTADAGSTRHIRRAPAHSTSQFQRIR